jgi:hypothetical protein
MIDDNPSCDVTSEESISRNRGETHTKEYKWEFAPKESTRTLSETQYFDAAA